MPQTLQQLSLWEPAAALAWAQRIGWHALDANSGAVRTGKGAITLDLALLTQDTRKHPLRLCLYRRRTCMLGGRCDCLLWRLSIRVYRRL